MSVRLYAITTEENDNAIGFFLYFVEEKKMA